MTGRSRQARRGAAPAGRTPFAPPTVAAAAVAAVLAAAVILAGAARADTLDDRVYAVASQLMCPVCAGQTVAESDSAVAREMRDVIRAKLRAGETPQAIVQFFVGQFGESVLAEPPRRGLSLLLYLGPAAGTAGGLAVAAVYIRRWTLTRRPRGAGGVPEEHRGEAGETADRSGPAETSAMPDPADRDRLARELEARERL
jgi:cytochrome c-type biogenesis protein CcmH